MVNKLRAKIKALKKEVRRLKGEDSQSMKGQVPWGNGMFDDDVLDALAKKQADKNEERHR
jgi:hypothetical protein